MASGANRWDVEDVRAVNTVARHEPRRRVVHLEGGAVRTTDFEAAETTFEVGEEFTERGVVVRVVRVPVVAERERRHHTGNHAVVERAFGIDVDVARNELHGGFVELHRTDVIGVDVVHARGDRAANGDGQRIARKRRTGHQASRDESSRPKESLFHVFLAVSAKRCSICTSQRKSSPVARASPGRPKLPPERVPD